MKRLAFYFLLTAGLMLAMPFLSTVNAQNSANEMRAYSGKTQVGNGNMHPSS